MQQKNKLELKSSLCVALATTTLLAACGGGSGGSGSGSTGSLDQVPLIKFRLAG